MQTKLVSPILDSVYIKICTIVKVRVVKAENYRGFGHIAS